MHRRFAHATACLAAFGLFACGEDAEDTPAPDDVGVQADFGFPPRDMGQPPLDMGQPPPDMGVMDMGAVDMGHDDAGAPDTGMPDMGPPPPQEVSVSGRVVGLGSWLAADNRYHGWAAVVPYGVARRMPVTSSEAPATLGNYAITVPANGQVFFFTSKAPGYLQTYTVVGTEDRDIEGRNLYLAEVPWLNAIAAAHGVTLGAPFPCETAQLTGQTCLYGAVVGRILDDGTAGAGDVRPVAGVRAADFAVRGGPMNGPWRVRGPYFLDYNGNPDPDAQASTTYQDGQGQYRGGLFAFFAEVPVAGRQPAPLEVSITYLSQGVNRYFGPRTVPVFRSIGTAVTWTTVAETGVAPPPPVENIDFDTQIYPLFRAVAQGGLGCQGCHTNVGGAQPAGGMNLAGGPEAAYGALDPARYPSRVNVQSPAMSYLLVRPLYEENKQDHPIFAFASEQDPAYQLIYGWIREGGGRDAPLAPVSFRNEVRPLLYNQVAQGGAGCRTCHFDGVDAQNAPGGFYMGGSPRELWEQIVNAPPTDNGATGEMYRINKDPQYPDRSLLLTNPLFGHPEPHPVKVFANTADPRYQLLYRWIVEGYVYDEN